jgi:glycosyltransferase involved in cell wall biosynthesis
MRLAVVVEQLLAPVPGGTGRYTRELIQALGGRSSSPLTVSTWTAWHRATSAARIPGAQGPRRLPLGRRGLALAWERGVGPGPRDADVVFAPTLLVPPRRGRPLVVTIPDTVPWTHPETLTPRGVAFHLRMGARAAADADAICVYTHAIARDASERLAIAPERIHVVGAGVSTAAVQLPPDAVGRRAALGVPGRYFLSVSTLEPRKGLDVLLDALAMAPNQKLVVVGQPGWGDVDLATAMRSRGLGPGQVLELGRIADADLAAVLAGATALAAPSRAEGFGLPLLEAMAAGVPVVASDIDAFNEVGGGAPLLVPVGDAAALAAALERVDSDDGLRGDLRRRGLERAAHYSWEETASRVWSVVSGLAG